MQLRDGNRIGSCASTQINATYLVSLLNKNLSNLHTNFLPTFSKNTPIYFPIGPLRSAMVF